MSSLLLNARRVTRAVALLDGLLGLVAELPPGRRPVTLAGWAVRPSRRLATVALTLLVTGATSAMALPIGRRLAADQLRSLLVNGR